MYLNELDKEKLDIFLYKIRRLGELQNSLDQNSSADACSILRALILDEKCLLPEIERIAAYKTKFQIVRPSFGILKVLPEPEYLFDGLEGNGPQELLRLDEFIEVELIWYRGAKYKVKDIIRLGANILGGVHVDFHSDRRAELQALMCAKSYIDPRAAIAQAIIQKELGIVLPINVLNPVQSVAGVVLRAIHPLVLKTVGTVEGC